MKKYAITIASAGLKSYYIQASLTLMSIEKNTRFTDYDIIWYMDDTTMIKHFPTLQGRVKVLPIKRMTKVNKWLDVEAISAESRRENWLTGFHEICGASFYGGLDLLKDYKRVIALDADVICQMDIEELFKLDLQGLPFGCHSQPYLPNEMGTPNAGVILMEDNNVESFDSWYDNLVDLNPMETKGRFCINWEECYISYLSERGFVFNLPRTYNWYFTPADGVQFMSETERDDTKAFASKAKMLHYMGGSVPCFTYNGEFERLMPVNPWVQTYLQNKSKMLIDFVSYELNNIKATIKGE